MLCDKCGAVEPNVYLEEEFTIRGSIWVPHCKICGWYGPIIIDYRIKLNKGDDEMASAKRGTCGNVKCKKEDTIIVAKGLCYVCYMKQKGPSKPRKCKNHSAVTHLNVANNKSDSIFISDGKCSKIAKVAAPTTATELKEQLESENKITLNFEGRDEYLLKLLKDKATKNRRTLYNEIMSALDNYISMN